MTTISAAPAIPDIVLLSLLGIVTFFLAKPLIEKKGKPFDTAVRDVVILARLKLYGRFFNR